MHQGSGCARSGGWPQGEPSSSPSWPSCCFAFGDPAPPRETIFRAVRPCDPDGRLRILRTSNANRARDDQWQIVVQLMASRGIMPPRATSSLGTNGRWTKPTHTPGAGQHPSACPAAQAAGIRRARRQVIANGRRMPSSVAISPVCGVITILPCWRPSASVISARWVKAPASSTNVGPGSWRIAGELLRWVQPTQKESATGALSKSSARCTRGMRGVSGPVLT